MLVIHCLLKPFWSMQKRFKELLHLWELDYDKAVASSHHSLGQSATASASALLAVTVAAMSEQQEEVQSTITRAEIYLKYATMTQAVVQSLTSVLYNRISQNDNSSMKTITVVTLFFLPPPSYRRSFLLASLTSMLGSRAMRRISYLVGKSAHLCTSNE
jgi:hypothetical protein